MAPLRLLGALPEFRRQRRGLLLQLPDRRLQFPGAGVGGMDEMIAHQEKKAALKRANTGEEVGDTAVYLLSDLSSGVTGETHHVDCGYNIVGMKAIDAPDMTVSDGSEAA